MPERVAVVGVEPGEVKTGIGLTQEVERALPAALERARTVLREMMVVRD
jgi:Ni,Fe-hydrogenase maturation factor